MQPQFKIAQHIARDALEGLFRKDGTTPAFVHSDRVGWKALKLFGALHATVGFLHDVPEDTADSDVVSNRITEKYLYERGIEIKAVEAIMAMTKRPGENYQTYLVRVKANPIARDVKIVDIIDNLSDNPSIEQINKYGAALKFLTE